VHLVIKVPVVLQELQVHQVWWVLLELLVQEVELVRLALLDGQDSKEQQVLLELLDPLVFRALWVQLVHLAQ
jgi:hypothetical protein